MVGVHVLQPVSLGFKYCWTPTLPCFLKCSSATGLLGPFVPCLSIKVLWKSFDLSEEPNYTLNYPGSNIAVNRNKT